VCSWTKSFSHPDTVAGGRVKGGGTNAGRGNSRAPFIRRQSFEFLRAALSIDLSPTAITAVTTTTRQRPLHRQDGTEVCTQRLRQGVLGSGRAMRLPSFVCSSNPHTVIAS